ncbi:MAG: C1 family peptidase [Bacteroidota bacterium]
MKSMLLILSSICFVIFSFSQNKDKLIFKSFDKSGSYYYNDILKDINAVEEKKNLQEPKKYYTYDFTGKNYPVDPEKYTKFWHNKPVSQGNSGTCWCFSATSFMESEVKRITGKEEKLSEMYTVYWEYVDRAADFVKTRGETYFEQGSESNAIPKIWKKYGIVPLSEYPGKEEGRKHHCHDKMVEEMKDYLSGVKKQNVWNEELVTSTIKSILDHYMGTPPEKFTINDKEYTPVTYLSDYLKINMNEYFSFMSTKEFAYNEIHELIEADNWWHAKNYYNLSLDDYMNLIKETIKQGYTISICGDISEPGRSSTNEISIIPDFDIPSEYINEDSRQFRLSNASTTDDHCIHVVGYMIVGDIWWFLMKDSGSSGFDGVHQGYCFYHEDYVKLKMMNILIHKDTAKKILDNIIK